MLKDGKGEMFFPGEDWRVERKKKTHALNQKYNQLTEYQPEQRKRSFVRYWVSLTKMWCVKVL